MEKGTGPAQKRANNTTKEKEPNAEGRPNDKLGSSHVDPNQLDPSQEAGKQSGKMQKEKSYIHQSKGTTAQSFKLANNQEVPLMAAQVNATRYEPKTIYQHQSRYEFNGKIKHQSNTVKRALLSPLSKLKNVPNKNFPSSPTQGVYNSEENNHHTPQIEVTSGVMLMEINPYIMSKTPLLEQYGNVTSPLDPLNGL